MFCIKFPSKNLCFVAKVTDTMELEGKNQPKFLTARFNPHHAGKQLATVVENSIRGWDLRSSRYRHILFNKYFVIHYFAAAFIRFTLAQAYHSSIL